MNGILVSITVYYPLGSDEMEIVNSNNIEIRPL